MFKPQPKVIGFECGNPSTSGQTFSLIMEYLKYGSLMHRLELGRCKAMQSPPIVRCPRKDWTAAAMFIGVDDWPLKMHLALGVARGIGAMHRDGVWHRDLKSSNILINEYHPVEVGARSRAICFSSSRAFRLRSS